MARPKETIKALIATDQLTADGGTVLRDRGGKLRTRRVVKFGFAGGTFLACLFLAIASIGLPFPGKVGAARAEATTIYANDRTTELYKIRGEKNRTAIGFDQMPKCIKDATVAVEDKSFYKHQGVDPRGIARAILVNLEVGGTSQGGSTITQQLVKNALLSPERTYTRKAKEMVLTLEIEQMYSKDDILRLYLNEIPYGSNAYGIEAAADTYFGKDAKDLTLAQCATLASLPRAPTFYSPYNNADPSRLKTRSKFVLDQMAEEKMITTAEAEAAKVEIDGPLNAQFTPAKGEDISAPHFVFYVREQLEQKYGTKVTQEGGLRVYTTLDKGKQDIAEEVVRDAAQQRFAGFGASNAALTSIDPKTGQILAMVGSVDYFDTAKEGNVNVATSERQPGSSFKPLVYLAAFKKGYDPNLRMAFNPATLLWDVKTDFGGGYAPNNYDGKFRGPVSARDALQQSLNVPAVKMLDMIGPEGAVDFAHQMGITTLNDPARYGDSLVLGGGEVKLVDMVSAYAVMANQGTAAYSQPIENGRKRLNATPFLEIKDRKGKTLERYSENKKSEIVKPELAYQITDVLKDDAARAPQFGRGSALTLAGREVAAKTGTTDNYKDAWTLGYTPSLAAGVWLGNNDGTPMNRVGGSLGAAPIWQEYMRRALAGDAERAKATKFDRPGGVKELQVDRLTGMLPNGKGQTKKEIFTDGNAPRDKSPVAGGACDTKIDASGLHSERPTNPAWENPVQAFIKSRGISIPGSGGDSESDECGPEVSIISPANGATVSGTIQVQARATSDRGVQSVELRWDGEVIGTDSEPPFTASHTITDQSGQHTISAKATDNDGNSKTATITVTVGEAEDDKEATLSLACTAARLCTATASEALQNVILVNADTGDSIAMTGTGTTYTATAPAGWTTVFAQGTDDQGNQVKSSSRSLAKTNGRPLGWLDAWLREDQYLA